MFISGSLHPLGAGNIKIDTTPVRFDYNDTIQEYIVPAGVKQLAVDCVGGSDSGKGGRVECILKVRPKQKLYIICACSSARGYNASDIRTIVDDLTSRIIVAGGGAEAGSGYYSPYAGGDGGGLIGGKGKDAYALGGTGGTQTEGGNGGNPGVLGFGGATDDARYTGQGGAGYYGGGGGKYARSSTPMKAHYNTSGGGGGSSYTDHRLCSDVIHTQGFNNSGNGWVILTPIK